jgi:hypothetical protein
MNNNDVKKCQEDSTLKRLSLKDLKRVRGGIKEDLFTAEYMKFIKVI